MFTFKNVCIYILLIKLLKYVALFFVVSFLSIHFKVGVAVGWLLFFFFFASTCSLACYLRLVSFIYLKLIQSIINKNISY